MRIYSVGCELPEGKVKLQDERFAELVRKCDPAKVAPFYVEVVQDDPVHADAIVISAERVLDILILDIEKLEGRLERSEDPTEQQLLRGCLRALEEEKPLFDLTLSPDELALVRQIGPISIKPTLVLRESLGANDIIFRVLERAGIVFFYTVGKDEVRAWPVPRDSDIVTCAGKIHTDLARGFIKADIVKYTDFLQVFNMQEARKKNLVRVVDRDYRIEDGDIVEIRFHV